MKNIAVILARSGSKGLPDKNIRPLNGVPLLAYSIKAALDSGIFDTVMVSTDSEEYARISREYGAEVPFLRSAETSGDRSSSWSAVREVIDNYEKLGKSFDMLSLLQPTSPLRMGKHLKEAYDLLLEKNANAVISVCENEAAEDSMNYLPQDLSLVGFCDDTVYRPRQVFGQLYRLNGAVFHYKVDAFKKQETIYDANVYAYIMDRMHSIDVDDVVDFQLTEAIIRYLPDFKEYFK